MEDCRWDRSVPEPAGLPRLAVHAHPAGRDWSWASSFLVSSNALLGDSRLSLRWSVLLHLGLLSPGQD